MLDIMPDAYYTTPCRKQCRLLNQLRLGRQWLAEIAQLVEHATENRGVVSSILTLGTPGQKDRPNCGRSTAVVRLLAKEKVVGSNPIARSSLRIADCQSAILIL